MNPDKEGKDVSCDQRTVERATARGHGEKEGHETWGVGLDEAGILHDWSWSGFRLSRETTKTLNRGFH